MRRKRDDPISAKIREHKRGPKPPFLSIHACWRDNECRSYGAPKRLYINTRYFGGLMIGAKGQIWLPILGYLPPHWKWTWQRVVYHPHHRKPGLLYRRYPELWKIETTGRVKRKAGGSNACSGP